MGFLSVAKILLFSAVLGVMMPTFDIYSDGFLGWNTIHFIGENMELLGCQACYGKSEEEVYINNLNNTCGTCHYDLYRNHGGLLCGAYPNAMKNMIELEKNAECNSNNDETFHLSNNYILEAGDCQKDDYCCFTQTKQLNRDVIEESYSDSV